MAGDSCDKEGARRLKKKIEEYWASKEGAPSVKLVDEGFVPEMRSARTDVRSDMVNGMPRKTSNKTKANQVPTATTSPAPKDPPCKPFSIRNRKTIER